jgi:hypothetical protein
MHPFLAIRAFFAVLFNRAVATQVRECLDKTKRSKSTGSSPLPSSTLPSSPSSVSEPTKGAIPSRVTAVPKPLERNGALTLLSALQREARLMDLVCESLDEYSDAQIGAAARDVLRDSKKVLHRMFGLKHLVDTDEGERVTLPENASPIRWRVIGSDASNALTLSHAGWQATKLDMPQWSGSSDDSMVIAPAEVEA